MSLFIDITDRKKLNEILSRLQPETMPLWGKMSAQHMVEHLTEQVQYTNGLKTCGLEVSEEEAIEKKQIDIYSDEAIPQGALSHLPINQLYCANLPGAIRSLCGELDSFHDYFIPAGRTAMHGGFGPLTYHEWLIWHGKHFTYHFKQFGIIS